MKTKHTLTEEEEKSLKYKFPLLGSREDKYKELIDFITQIKDNTKTSLIKGIMEDLEGMKDNLPKEKCMNLENHMFGSCFQCEKSKGRNKGIEDIQTYLESLIKEL